MSYHILHITKTGSRITVDSGLLFCEIKETNEKLKLPIDDIKAVIVCNPAVSFTNNAIAALLKNDIVIQHCDRKFQPVGWSIPLTRIVKPKVFYNQLEQNETFQQKLWKIIVKQKAINQAYTLELMGQDSCGLMKLINKPLLNEANIAKKYWQAYFSCFESVKKREHKNSENFENACLNYGYAVIKTLIYRSILIHGLLAELGIHHKGNFKTTPLVYDLVEPFRAVVDLFLFYFFKEQKEEFKNAQMLDWAKFLSECLKNYRIKHSGLSYKLVDIIDIYIEKIANSFLEFDVSQIFLPNVKEVYFCKDKQKNREYEE